MCSRDDVDRAMSAALAPVVDLRRHLFPLMALLVAWERLVRTGVLPANVAGFHAIVAAPGLPPRLKRAMIGSMASMASTASTASAASAASAASRL